jgi:proteic killer suppression protein
MDREVAKFPPDVLKAAVRKLDMLEAAVNLQDLASPPGNKLHALKDDLIGYFAISINSRWRIIFRWVDGDDYSKGGPSQVEIVDYH